MRGAKYLYLILLGLWIFSCKGDKPNDTNEIVDETSGQEGWVSLFDGKSYDGWKTYLKDSIPSEWQIEEGAMVFRPNPEKDPGMNNLITEKQYESFELSLEWKIEKDGNSGIFYWVQEDEKYVVPYLTAPEVQLRDYSSNPDFEDKKQMSGAIFGLVGPDRNYARPPGEWNRTSVKIDLENNVGEVRLNGEELFSYPVHGASWDSLVAQSKFKDWEAFAKIRRGHIGLQDHAHEVWFRNIRIRELPESD